MNASVSNICLCEFHSIAKLLLEPDIRDDKTATTSFNDHSTGVYKTLQLLMFD